MPRDTGPSLNERNFVAAALAEGVRLDGRPLNARRPVRMRCQTTPGCVTVEMGETKVFCRISAEITKPFPERPFDGIFNVTVELSPMASPVFESGRPNDTDPLLSRLLEKSLRRSGSVDTEALCLRAGRSVWAVRADVHVLSADGALVDACCAAAIAGLQHFRLPATTVHSGADGEGVTVWAADRRTPVPLGIRHAPYAATTAFLRSSSTSATTTGPAANADGGAALGGGGTAAAANDLVALADPTRLELACAEGEVVVTANREGEICQIAKLGGVPADAVAVLEVVERAVADVKVVAKAVAAALEADAQSRAIVDGEAKAVDERRGREDMPGP